MVWEPVGDEGVQKLALQAPRVRVVGCKGSFKGRSRRAQMVETS